MLNTLHPQVEYLPDDSLDEAGDRELRGLLTTCFTKPQDAMFKHRRYYREPYPHRWVIRDQAGALIAHVGVHEKRVTAKGGDFRIGGICEVCVHPDSRGRGYVRLMLSRIHGWLTERGFDFAVLFGDPLVYGSSGYVQVQNLFHDAGQPNRREQVTAMVKALAGKPWPAGEVYLPGLPF